MSRRKSYWRVCLGCNEVSGLPCLCWGDNILSSFGSGLWTVNKTEIIHRSPMKSHMGLAGHLATDKSCRLSDYPCLGCAGESYCAHEVRGVTIRILEQRLSDELSRYLMGKGKGWDFIYVIGCEKPLWGLSCFVSHHILGIEFTRWRVVCLLYCFTRHSLDLYDLKIGLQLLLRSESEPKNKAWAFSFCRFYRLPCFACYNLGMFFFL